MDDHPCVSVEDRATSIRGSSLIQQLRIKCELCCEFLKSVVFIILMGNVPNKFRKGSGCTAR